MEIETVSPSNEPRLGLFWFIAKDRSPSRFASLSRPFSGVSEVAGFKTLDEGHVDIWPTVQRLDQILMDYDYDYFPRGRVNWRKEDDRWLLVLDPKQSQLRIPMKPAMHSNLKPATCSDPKPAGVPI